MESRDYALEWCVEQLKAGVTSTIVYHALGGAGWSGTSRAHLVASAQRIIEDELEEREASSRLRVLDEAEAALERAKSDGKAADQVQAVRLLASLVGVDPASVLSRQHARARRVAHSEASTTVEAIQDALSAAVASGADVGVVSGLASALSALQRGGAKDGDTTEPTDAELVEQIKSLIG